MKRFRKKKERAVREWRAGIYSASEIARRCGLSEKTVFLWGRESDRLSAGGLQ